MHPILNNILLHERPFFSYTENSLEVSIIADMETCQNDFHFYTNEMCPGFQICPDPFFALQIDNEDGIDSSGKRISELSQTLAGAGISIFYLSTYQTDFIFVILSLPLIGIGEGETDEASFIRLG